MMNYYIHTKDCCRQIREHVEQIGFNVSSCGNDMLGFRRCLAASFFLKAAQRQLDGTYRLVPFLVHLLSSHVNMPIMLCSFAHNKTSVVI